jgi:hypothetical protein
MKCFPLAFFFLLACETPTETGSGSETDTDTDTDADSDTDADTDSDTDTDTGGDTGTEAEECGAETDLGARGANAVTLDVDYDTYSLTYAFGNAFASDYTVTLASDAAPANADGLTYAAQVPDDRWVARVDSVAASDVFMPTLHTGYGAFVNALRVFRRDGLAERYDFAGWTYDPTMATMGVYALDPSGAAVTGATVRVNGDAAATPFIWVAESVYVGDQTLTVHLPEASEPKTQGGAVYFRDVCPGMVDVSVEGPCGPCVLGRASGVPTNATIATDADTMSLSWWTCHTTC